MYQGWWYNQNCFRLDYNQGLRSSKHWDKTLMYITASAAERELLQDNLLIAAAAKSLQSCPTLCNPIDGSPPGSPVPGILQARILEWVAISSSNAWKWKVKIKSLSRVRLPATRWTAAHQAPPSMGFSRQEYGVGCHCLLNKEQFSLSHGKSADTKAQNQKL